MTAERSLVQAQVGVQTAILSDAKPSCQGGTGQESRRVRQSERAARLAADGEHLAPSDRQLMQWVYGEGRAVTTAARMLGVPHRGLQRRISRLVRRCDSPEFAFVLARLSSWDSAMARVARICVLQGHSTRHASEVLGMSIHAVRARRIQVLAMARGARSADAISTWRE